MVVSFLFFQLSTVRLSPNRASTHRNTGTQWGQGGCESAANGARDVISIMAATEDSRDLTVSIGEYRWVFKTRPDTGVSYFEAPFGWQTTGPVRLTLDGKETEGPPITNECCHGQVRFTRLVEFTASNP